MEKQSLINVIQSGIPISMERTQDIVAHFNKIDIHKNDFFLKEGSVSNNYLFLENGLMRAFTFDTNGDEITTAFYSNNQFVFEVASLFQRIPSKENIQAIEDCQGWSLTFDSLQTLFHTIPEFREFGRGILVKGFISFKQRSLSLINETAEQRYENLMKERPEILQRAPLKHIASYLGVTDSSLSRIRRQFLKK
jgi:CRP-like cAMP-binding protein